MVDASNKQDYGSKIFLKIKLNLTIEKDETMIDKPRSSLNYKKRFYIVTCSNILNMS
jgi:hypothetical protein